MYYKKNKRKVSTNDMKPRIFVSSTFYDLKYIREDLSSFIRDHDFEPIMFEDGDVGYVPGECLDISCYETMKTADMVILIIGGLYGSAATGEIKDKFEEYVSITRNEFRTAFNGGVPIFVFVDSKVYSEYAVYEMNMKEIESKNLTIKFSATKDINIFRFIKEIKNIGNISITEFSKLTEIKEFLSKQWSDMFKKYLEIIKQNKSDEKVKDAVAEMNILVQKMNLMLDSVGKKILSNGSSGEYENVLEKQNLITVGKRISQGMNLGGISWMDSLEKRERVMEKLLNVIDLSLKTDVWKKFASNDSEKIRAFFEFFKKNEVDLRSVSVGMEKDLKNIEKIIGNPQAKQMLIEMLCSEGFYEEMVYVDEELDEIAWEEI